MKRILATLALVAALAAASVTITADEADANPALIFGVVAWKFVAIAATSLLVGGAIGASAARGPYVSPEGCPVHISRRDGHRYVRANCT